MDKMRLVQKGYISSRNTVGLFDERENEIMWIDRLDEYDVEKGKTYIDLVRLLKKWNLFDNSQMEFTNYNVKMSMRVWNMKICLKMIRLHFTYGMCTKWLS